MKFLYSQYSIAVLIGLSLIVTMVYAAWIEARQHNYVVDKNWWSISYAEPRGESHDFVIENYTDRELFHYVIYVDDNVLLENDVVITSGKSKYVEVDLDNPSEEVNMIEIILDKEIKTLYK